MLQYITQTSAPISILRQVEAVVGGGGKWVELRMDGAAPEELRDEALKIMPICQEQDVIMMIHNDVTLVDELHVHGVHIDSNGPTPREAREKLGPHAIIGVSIASAADAVALRGLDIDYLTLPFDNFDSFSATITEIRQSGCILPIVASGNITTSLIVSALGAGAQGVAVGQDIACAPNAEEKTRQMLATLQS